MKIKPLDEKLIMKDDILFKLFFSKIGHEKYIKDFLSAILGEEVKIKKVIHDSRLEQLARETKYGVLDLDIELKDGEIVNIEMQMKNNHNIEKRTTFYASKKVTEQLGPKEKYESLKKVIIITILDYSFIDLPEYVTKTIRVANKHRDYELNNDVTYYYIELEKFRRSNPDMTEQLNQWLAFLDMERGDLLEMAKKNSKIIKEAYGDYEVLTGAEETKRLQELRLMSYLEEQSALATARDKGAKEGKKIGIKEGKKQGIEEGKKQGVEEGKRQGIEEGKKQGIEEGKRQGLEAGQKQKQIEIAKNMLEENISIEKIMKLTGLTKEEIKKMIE